MSDLDMAIDNSKRMLKYLQQKLEVSAYELNEDSLIVLENSLSDAISKNMKYEGDKTRSYLYCKDSGIALR